MNERLKELRKYLGYTLEEFGKRVGVTRSAIGRIEKGERALTDQMFLSICREFNVSSTWLRSGEGEMFLKVPEDDEIAMYVSDLLEDDGTNPLYEIIIEIMRTYDGLSPKSQEVIRDASAKLLENLRKKKEG